MFRNRLNCKTLISSIVVCLIIQCLAFPAYASDENLLINPEWEYGIDGWESDINTSVKLEDPWSYHCTSVSQEVPLNGINQDDKIVLSGEIAVANESSLQRLIRMQLDFLDNEGKVIESLYEDEKEKELKYHEIEAYIPDNAASLKVILSVYKTSVTDNSFSFKDLCLKSESSQNDSAFYRVAQEAEDTISKDPFILGDDLDDYMGEWVGQFDDGEILVFDLQKDSDWITVYDIEDPRITETIGGIYMLDPSTGDLLFYSYEYGSDYKENADLALRFRFSDTEHMIAGYVSDSDPDGENVLTFVRNTHREPTKYLGEWYSFGDTGDAAWHVVYSFELVQDGRYVTFSRGPFDDDYYRIYYVCTYSFDPETDDLVLHVIGYLYGEGEEEYCPDKFIFHFRDPDHLQYKDSTTEDFYELIFER